MYNEIWVVATLLFVYGSLVLFHKIFGKAGLMAWIPMSAIVSNILVLMQYTAFGLRLSGGALIFSTSFLATDILSECYGTKYATKAVWMGFTCLCFYTVLTQLVLMLTPNELFKWGDNLEALLGINIRISIASISMFLVANLADVYLYSAINKWTKGRAMWLRNNVATMVTNIAENMLFMIIGFYGIWTVSECIQQTYHSSIGEFVLALFDTPFLYAAVRSFKKKAVVVA